MFSDKLRVIPLGGVEEVGKNCLVFEYKNDILVVDLGLEFPNPDYPGVQYLLPDISYLKSNQKKIRNKNWKKCPRRLIYSYSYCKAKKR